MSLLMQALKKAEQAKKQALPTSTETDYPVIDSSLSPVAAPEIPTIAETYPDCVGEVWVAIFAPVGGSADVIKKVQAAMEKTLSKSEVREKLSAQGLDLAPVSTNKLSSLLKDELAKWAKIVKASGAQLD